MNTKDGVPRSKHATIIPYMVTISCQQKGDYISKVMIDEVIMWLKMNIDSLHIIRSVYESSGKYRQLHWHAIVVVKRNFHYAPYTQYGQYDINKNTYRMQWRRIYDMEGAINYISKDLRYRSQEAILQSNYFSINRFYEKALTYTL